MVSLATRSARRKRVRGDRATVPTANACIRPAAAPRLRPPPANHPPHRPLNHRSPALSQSGHPASQRLAFLPTAITIPNLMQLSHVLRSPAVREASGLLWTATAQTDSCLSNKSVPQGLRRSTMTSSDCDMLPCVTPSAAAPDAQGRAS